MTVSGSHMPVMVDEVLAALAPRAGEVFVDATFGVGGYTRAILEAASCDVWAIDRDPDAIARADAMRATYGARLHVRQGVFGDMERLLGESGVAAADGIAFDLGVSSPQLDDPERGFSFQADGPLDMRQSASGQSAADFVNQADEATLAGVISELGEERHARRIARAIARRRASSPFTRTRDLAEVVAIAAPAPPGPHRLHPATRTFQAIRIFINDELGELRRGLAAAERLLRAGGRLVVVAFHSLEDRIVKEFLAERSGRTPLPTRHLPAPLAAAPTFIQSMRKAQRPSEDEVVRNPRARSARLRWAVRTDAAPLAVAS